VSDWSGYQSVDLLSPKESVGACINEPGTEQRGSFSPGSGGSLDTFAMRIGPILGGFSICLSEKRYENNIMNLTADISAPTVIYLLYLDIS
jgi:hypothetical protein